MRPPLLDSWRPMKKIALLALLYSVSSATFAQHFIETMASGACQCIEKIATTVPAKDLKLEVGLCIMKTYKPEFEKPLKAEYGIDIHGAKDGMENFGRIVALRMATSCPSVLARVSRAAAADGDLGSESISGTVIKIEKDGFVAFTVKDQAGKTGKFYWMGQIDSGIDLVNNYNALLDRQLTLSFENKEYFDPKIDEYRKFKVITKIK